MNNIIDWFKNLEFEIIVILLFLLVILIVLIRVLIKNNMVYNAIAKKTLIAKEDLLLEDGKYITRVNTTNIGYTSSIVKELGFIYKDLKLPIRTEEFNLNSRDFDTTLIDVNELRSFVVDEKNKLNKHYFYVIDSVNRVTKIKMKLSYKHLKGVINEEKRIALEELRATKKAQRLENKEARYSTGEYNFGDRIVLILGAIFSPLVKLSKLIKAKINKSLRKREIKKEVKRELLKEQLEQNKAKVLANEQELKDQYTESYGAKLSLKQVKKDDKAAMKKENDLVNNDVEELEVIEEQVAVDVESPENTEEINNNIEEEIDTVNDESEDLSKE